MNNLDKGMTVIVTGSSGFIGKKLCIALSLKGYKVLQIQRTISDSPNVINLDLSEELIPDSICKKTRFIFHLAGLAHDTAYSSNEELYKRANITSSINVASQAKKNAVKKVIYMSSVKAFEAESGGDAIYSTSKLKAEKSISSILDDCETELAILRSSAVYGPSSPGLIGKMFKAIKSGWFPPLPNFNNKRSMVHVDDIVDLLIFLAEKKTIKDQIYVGADNGLYNSEEIYDLLRKASGRSPVKLKIPVIFFNIAFKLVPNGKFYLSKLSSNEYYNNLSVVKLGYKFKYLLSDIERSKYV